MTGYRIWCSAVALALLLGGIGTARSQTLDLEVQVGDVRVPRPAAQSAPVASESTADRQDLVEPGALGVPTTPLRRINGEETDFLGGLLDGKTIPLFRVSVPGAMFGGGARG